jgi:hypothetical protein
MIETIDYSKEYSIETIPSRDIKEFSERGLGTYPGIIQTISVGFDDFLQKYTNTGFDEFSKEVLSIPDTEERKAVQARIVAKREELEHQLNLPGCLKPTSDHWINFGRIQIEVGQDLKIRIKREGNSGELNDNILRPSTSFRDAIALTVLLNHKDFPKSKEDISKHPNSKFYLTTKEETSVAKKSERNKTNKAHSQMDALFSGKKSDKALQVAYALGVMGYNQDNIDTVYDTVYDAVFMDKSQKTLDKFLEICSWDNTTLMTRNLFKLATEFRIIGVNKDGYYRGKTNYRSTVDESINFLLSPGNEIELANIREEVNKYKKRYNVKFDV